MGGTNPWWVSFVMSYVEIPHVKSQLMKTRIITTDGKTGILTNGHRATIPMIVMV